MPVERLPAGKLGMWVFLATDAMGFAGLLLALVFLRTRAAAWPDPAVRFDRGLAFGLTLALIASGATMTAALGAARAGRAAAARRLTLVTAGLGLAFVLGQMVELRSLVVTRHVSLTTDHAAGLFFIIASYHGLHVVVGVALLAFTALGRAKAPAHGGAPAPALASAKVPDRQIVPATLEVLSLYWQFVDAAWLVLFAVLYLLPSGTHG